MHSVPIVIPRPSPSECCAPSVGSELTSSLDGGSPRLDRAAVGGNDIEGDDGRDVLPPGVDPISEAKSLEHVNASVQKP